MMVAVYEAELKTIGFLLANGGDIEQGCLVMYAVLARRIDKLELLVGQGAAINVVCDEDNPEYWSLERRLGSASTGPYGTPLHYMVRKGDRNMVEALLRRGANPEIRDSDGRTALDIAQIIDWEDREDARDLRDMLRGF